MVIDSSELETFETAFAVAVARFFAGIHRKAAAQDRRPQVEVAESNGESALLVFQEGQLETVFVVSVEQGLIAAIYAVRNPDKLAWLERRLEGASGRPRSPVV